MIGNLIFCLACAIPVGVISLTVSKTHLFLSFREKVKAKSSFFGKLVSCPLCLSFWIAGIGQLFFHATLEIINLPINLGINSFLNYILGWLTIVGFAPLSAGFMYKTYSIMVDSNEEIVDTENSKELNEKVSLLNSQVEILSELNDWWLYGEYNLSAEAMILAILGNKQKNVNTHPVNEIDFIACINLLKQCPSLIPYLDDVRSISPDWNLSVDIINKSNSGLSHEELLKIIKNR